MRYATFSTQLNPTQRLGIVSGDRVIDAAALAAPSWNGEPPSSLMALITSGPEAWARLAGLASRALTSNVESQAAEDIRWHAPIPRPLKNVACIGKNWAEHAREIAKSLGQEPTIPKFPVFFTKAPTTVVGPFDDVAWDPAITLQVDWEVELAAILGRTGRNISRGDALNHVFGYTVLNDVTARDLQRSHQQFYKGKSLDTFCPMGPVVVTADEFGDPQSKSLTCRVNGVVKQQGVTGDMIFPVDAIIESLSLGMTLEAGDIIATGTPDGVGFGRTPPEFLADGDVLETAVEGIGMMRNIMRAPTGRRP